MNKTLSYRLFRLGAIPGKVRPLLEREDIVVADEGMSGWFIARNVKGPGKRYRYRWRGFSGCLVVTRKRVLSYAYWKRQINISVDDPRISELYFTLPDETTLTIFFEASAFNAGWEGVMEYRFRTEKATQFGDALRTLGVRQGATNNVDKPLG